MNGVSKMFRAIMPEPKIMRNTFAAISNLIDEANLRAKEDGLYLRAMDPAHVALVDMEMRKEIFEEYEIDEEKTFGIDLDRLMTVLKRAKSDDRIILEHKEEVLRITIENSAKRSFDLPLIDVSEEEIRIPELDYPCVIEIDPDAFEAGIKDAETVSDHVTLKASEDGFFIVAKGDLGNVEVQIRKEQTLTFDINESARSMFSIEYLKDILKASKIADSIKVYLGNDIPVKLEFLAPGIKLTFLLAPRIESE